MSQRSTVPQVLIIGVSDSDKIALLDKQLKELSSIISVVADDRNIFQHLEAYTPDVLISIGKWSDFTNLQTLPFYWRSRWIDYPTVEDINIDDIYHCFFATPLTVRDSSNTLLSIVTHLTGVFTTEMGQKLCKSYDSLKNQIHTAWEWIIVREREPFFNLGPSETEIKLRDQLKSLTSDPRIKFHVVSNNPTLFPSPVGNPLVTPVIPTDNVPGISSGINGKPLTCGEVRHRALGLCRGLYFLELEAGDQLHPGCLRKLTEAEWQYPDADIFYFDVAKISSSVDPQATYASVWREIPQKPEGNKTITNIPDPTTKTPTSNQHVLNPNLIQKNSTWDVQAPTTVGSTYRDLGLSPRSQTSGNKTLASIEVLNVYRQPDFSRMNKDGRNDITNLKHYGFMVSMSYYTHLGGYHPKLNNPHDCWCEFLFRGFNVKSSDPETNDGNSETIPEMDIVHILFPGYIISQSPTDPSNKSSSWLFLSRPMQQYTQKIIDKYLTDGENSDTPNDNSNKNQWETSGTPDRIINKIYRDRDVISIVTPTYNRSKDLCRAIRSILNQDLNPDDPEENKSEDEDDSENNSKNTNQLELELTIVGDCCPQLQSGMLELMKTFPDPRIKWYNLLKNTRDSGTSPRNYALKRMVSGDLVAYLDDDNTWDTNHLRSLYDALCGYAGEQSVRKRKSLKSSFALSSFIMIVSPKEEYKIIVREPKKYRVDTSAILHQYHLLNTYGYWDYQDKLAHDWELVDRWLTARKIGEPYRDNTPNTTNHNNQSKRRDREKWAVTLQPTLKYMADPRRVNARGIYEIYGDQK